MIRIATVVFFVLFATNFSKAQDAKPDENKPVTGVFNSGVFLDNQTSVMLPKNTFEFVINHRFGKLSDGNYSDNITSVFGLYSPSNIRLGINYGITEKLQVGLGATKTNDQEDLNYKYSFIEQTTNNKIPVSVVFFGATYLDARLKSASVYSYDNYKYVHRFSYYNELMISRKFCDKFSLQAAATYAHLNIVDQAIVPWGNTQVAERLRRNDQFGMSALAKLNITQTIAFICSYDQDFSKLYKQATDAYPETKPNFALGLENATAAHSFQVFVTTASSITNQTNMVYNTNPFSTKGLGIGFNITRVFY